MDSQNASQRPDGAINKFIPASQRPDGTWRKARRVKDGYVPQEEVPLYKSKGKEFADRKSTLPQIPPGMCPIVAEASRRERERQERAKAKREAAAALALTAAIEAPAKAAAKKLQTTSSAKAKHHKNAATTSSIGQLSHPNCNMNSSSNNNVDALTNGLASNLQLNDDDDEHADNGKQLKKLRKKIREIESIEERLKSGELKKPEKDQLDKVKRKDIILKEINELEQVQLQLQLDGHPAATTASSLSSIPYED